MSWIAGNIVANSKWHLVALKWTFINSSSELNFDQCDDKLSVTESSMNETV